MLGLSKRESIRERLGSIQPQVGQVMNSDAVRQLALRLKPDYTTITTGAPTASGFQTIFYFEPINSPDRPLEERIPQGHQREVQLTFNWRRFFSIKDWGSVHLHYKPETGYLLESVVY